MLTGLKPRQRILFPARECHWVLRVGSIADARASFLYWAMRACPIRPFFSLQLMSILL